MAFTRIENQTVGAHGTKTFFFCPQCFEVDPHVFDKLAFRTAATVIETNFDRHSQVLQHLQSGIVFVRVRT